MHMRIYKYICNIYILSTIVISDMHIYLHIYIYTYIQLDLCAYIYAKENKI